VGKKGFYIGFRRKTSEGMRLPGRHGHKWEDIIKIDLEKWDGVVRTGFILFRIRDHWRALYKQSNKPSGSMKLWEIPE
jgi:hypothetical protein